MNHYLRSFLSTRAAGRVPALGRLSAGLALLTLASSVWGTTNLADKPIYSNTKVAGNLAIPISVEFPTAVSVAYPRTGGGGGYQTGYSPANTYVGYFDPVKCYTYMVKASPDLSRFEPAGEADNRTCVGSNDDKWSGNFLNWATMQTIDPFRWALTGGYRVIDTPTETVLEKAWASGQGGTANFPNSRTGSATTAGATPFSWTRMRMRIQGLGNRMLFSSESADPGGATSGIAYDPAVHTPTAIANDKVYELVVRVKVCDSSAAAGPLEANCTAYPNGYSKPTGLMQQYSEAFRYSVFGYLNDDNLQRDGGVLRAAKKFIGPQEPQPTSLPIANPAKEWNEFTGQIFQNPDAQAATDTNNAYGLSGTNAVANSGVLNYINKFGQITPGSFKTYDPVGELYYAAIRYYKNLGNIDSWSSITSTDAAYKAKLVDGFPVVQTWKDPVQYWCQRNYVLGIGDVNTHADKNVPGAGSLTSQEPAKPDFGTAETLNAVTSTNKVGALEGLGSSLGTQNPYNGCCNSNSALMAGTAYHANTTNLRTDLTTKPGVPAGTRVTVQTYWLDVLEYQTYKSNNQFYLAAKYGGFKVPQGFNPDTRTDPLPDAWWTTGDLTPGGQSRPNNYFTAGNATQMVDGLRKLFARAFADLSAFSTSFGVSLPNITATGTSSYSGKFDASNWTGDVTANAITINATTGQPEFAEQWKFSEKLATQVAGVGWDTNRRIVTWNTRDKRGVPFRYGDLSPAQQNTLDTVYRTGNDAEDYVKYLRGDPTHEVSSTATGSAKIYRDRTSPVGDIVNSAIVAVTGPTELMTDGYNPGYRAFSTGLKDRRTMLYVGSNAGVLHAIDGTTLAANGTADAYGGREVFAYVPGALYQGANGVPVQTGLMHRGDPDFNHKFLVDSTPAVWDIDFNRTADFAPAFAAAPDWRTILVGGLGKGGKGYFALDVTNPIPDPASPPSEGTVAGKVLWEITNATPNFEDLGYSYGQALVVKTKRHGWVAIFGSGYNNTNGRGYVFVVNARTGAFIHKFSTPDTGPYAGTTGNQAGLAHLEAWIPEIEDVTADAVYAGDLLGNLWRFDLTRDDGNYPDPTVPLALVTNANGNPVPITTRPMLQVHPDTGDRMVGVGTGKMLDATDLTSNEPQVYWVFRDGLNDFGAFVDPNKTKTAQDRTTLPPGVNFPLQRNNLVQQTNLLNQVEFERPFMGFWLDLGALAGGNDWRVIRESDTFFGRIAFVATLPVVEDACQPFGTSKLFALDLRYGQTILLNAADQPIATLNIGQEVISVRTLASGSGEHKLSYGTSAGSGGFAKTAPLPALQPKRLNWREIRLTN